MDIQYLKNLDNNKIVSTPSGGMQKLQPISLDEIVSLEEKYNDKKQFPIVLRELLHIAGQDCYLLDYGINETQDEMQMCSRSLLSEYEGEITRPFFVIDVYNANEQFVFVYLDEDQIDPIVYQAYLPYLEDTTEWINTNGRKLSEYVNRKLDLVLNDINPF
jgi:hypothetical protein